MFTCSEEIVGLVGHETSLASVLAVLNALLSSVDCAHALIIEGSNFFWFSAVLVFGNIVRGKTILGTRIIHTKKYAKSLCELSMHRSQWGNIQLCE